MCLFIETIKIDQQLIYRLDYHQMRFNRTRQHFFENSQSIKLAKIISIPNDNQLYRCRITYGKHIEKVELFPYQKKNIDRLKIIHPKTINYQYKYANRDVLNQLNLQKDQTDDILIAQNGLLSDTTIANIALLKQGQWFTPATPLLEGTHRAYLLDKKLLVPTNIKVSDLDQYTHLTLFNAMLEFKELCIPINKQTIQH